MKVMILGASGMLGNAMMRYFMQSQAYNVYGSTRSDMAKNLLPDYLHTNIISNVDVDNFESIARQLSVIRPDIVINCVGLVKQLDDSKDVLKIIPINTILPHRLVILCDLIGAKLIHISTDCVFSGSRGMYTEVDVADANDLYGRSKYLGEVDYPNAITLRTSIIGHELIGAYGLINWFLNQKNRVEGYRKAIFSGLPTVEIARIIMEYVIPNPEMHGVYHLSSYPVNKYALLSMVADIYKKKISIEPNDEFVIDRSLDSTRFRAATGYSPEPWPELVRRMHAFG